MLEYEKQRTFGNVEGWTAPPPPSSRASARQHDDATERRRTTAGDGTRVEAWLDDDVSGGISAWGEEVHIAENTFPASQRAPTAAERRRSEGDAIVSSTRSSFGRTVNAAQQSAATGKGLLGSSSRPLAPLRPHPSSRRIAASRKSRPAEPVCGEAEEEMREETSTSRRQPPPPPTPSTPPSRAPPDDRKPKSSDMHPPLPPSSPRGVPDDVEKRVIRSGGESVEEVQLRARVAKLRLKLEKRLFQRQLRAEMSMSAQSRRSAGLPMVSSLNSARNAPTQHSTKSSTHSLSGPRTSRSHTSSSGVTETLTRHPAALCLAVGRGYDRLT
ncbi:hypothetical protein PPROV_000600200 [Pycnococcus provasolii]|uniref:Uncharacterized protein n=1 Tax=Pycnococcus provasolii TaxID=41880 RepID=A0A830HP83_9CHLO|nr:hypothetical protein PPROV_000600200 [Pycnococcus provasolii]